MQNTDPTSKGRRDDIRKAYADYSRLMDDIDTLDKASDLLRGYKEIQYRDIMPCLIPY